MNCTTSFTVPYPDNTEIPHEKMDCQQALEFIQKVSPPCGYLNKVEVIASGRFLSNTSRYALVSNDQFNCLLTCGTESPNRREYLKCKKICEGKEDNVILNDLDAGRLGKYPPA